MLISTRLWSSHMPVLFAGSDIADFGFIYTTDTPDYFTYNSNFHDPFFSNGSIFVGDYSQRVYPTAANDPNGTMGEGLDAILSSPTRDIFLRASLVIPSPSSSSQVRKNSVGFFDVNGTLLFVLATQTPGSVSFDSCSNGSQTPIVSNTSFNHATSVGAVSGSSTSTLPGQFALKLEQGAAGYVGFWIGNDQLLDYSGPVPDLGPIHSVRFGGYSLFAAAWSEIVVATSDMNALVFRVKSARATSSGTLNQWADYTGDVNFTSKMSYINETNTHTSATHYLASFTDGWSQTFDSDADNLPPGSWEPVHAYVSSVVSRNTLPPSGMKMDGHRHVLRVGGVPAESEVTHEVGEVPVIVRSSFPVNPATLAPWAPGDLAGFEFGFKSELQAFED
jgi:hypothetical protein